MYTSAAKLMRNGEDSSNRACLEPDGEPSGKPGIVTLSAQLGGTTLLPTLGYAENCLLSDVSYLTTLFMKKKAVAKKVHQRFWRTAGKFI